MPAYDPCVVGSTFRHALIGAVIWTCGCGGPLAKTRAENTRLQSTVTDLRADSRRDKRRIRELENRLALLEGGDGSPERARRDGDMPSLRVEVVAPGTTPPAGDRDPSLSDLGEGAELVGVAEDGTEIVYVGDAAAGRPGTLSGDDLTPDRMPAGARLARARTRASASEPAGPDDASQRYDQAIARLRSGDHVAAVALLRELITRYPRHELADNAQYWIGEAFYDQKDYPRAIAEFRRAASTYPRGNKVPDALLKLGFSYLASGQIADGRRTLEQVIAGYPRTGPARLAAARLESLGRGGSP
jgi:tol-pal system protein YbgF